MASKVLGQVALVVGAVAVAGLASAEPARAPADDAARLELQPHMAAALEMLTGAKNQLNKATPDKGGHRAKAIVHTNAAITEVKKGIEYDNKHSVESPAGDAIELEVQPRMAAALALLEASLDQLQKASPDKGGHRVKAIEHVKDAISETKQGMEYDNKH